MSDGATPGSGDPALDLVKRVWGYEEFRPLQREAIEAGLESRDSLVVLPTGGGKSLCYQVPAVLAGRTDVVVSPLISLMKDQVDALRAVGVPAAALHSLLSPAKAREVRQRAAGREYRMLFVSPERLLTGEFLDLLGGIEARAFAVDEAHCISHWGHDFRPEYRQLRALKERFPEAAVHAFTATATERVREDIVAELGLRSPRVLVGRFDRGNLVYRVVPRTDPAAQTAAVLERHRGEAAIVYCLSRKDTESLAAALVARGFRAAAYHAGMEKEERNAVQDRFAAEEVDVVVATVAFGMGIDKSDVRCVVHASLPKSVEHYQQETGRAGRDGLPAECVLLYSPADALKWDRLLTRSAAQADEERAAPVAAQRELLSHMSDYGQVLVCRHRFLSRYFGQDLDGGSCGACDVCLEEVEALPDSTVVAQKILSCVARLDERFGVGYVVEVLRGTDSETVRSRGHHRLSTFGLLPEIDEKSLTNLVYQLVGQGALERTAGDRPVLRLTPDSVAILKGRREVMLRPPAARKVRRTRAEAESWEGVDRGLFERLRALRKRLAAERGVPAYVILGDRALRSLARQRPATLGEMAGVWGIGERKLAELGEALLAEIAAWREGSPPP